MIPGIDNVGVAARDLRRSVEFYQNLGFVKAFQSERGCTMMAGTTKLFLFPAGPEESLARLISLEGNPPGTDHMSFWWTMSIGVPERPYSTIRTGDHEEIMRLDRAVICSCPGETLF